MKQIVIRIYPNGIIKAETINMKGHECQKYVNTIGKLTGAAPVDSSYLDTFFDDGNDVLVTEESNAVKETITSRLKL